ncbi:MAG: cytochrome P450 [Gammaproteobacteria bacterium]|jgi:cytochrome P450
MLSEEQRLELSEPDIFQDHEKVHAIFTWMREHEPVAFCPENYGGKGFWSITKYDDIQEISKNPKLFSSDAGIVLEEPEMRRIKEGRSAEDQNEFEVQMFESGSSMIVMDPPQHTKHRRMVAPGFTPQKLDALVPRIRECCTKILDQISDKSECEFVTNVAAELPIQMLAELLDVPREDRLQLFEWSNIVIGGDDPDVAISREHVVNAFTQMAMYALALREKREKEPGDDLISMVVNTPVDGKPISMEDYLAAFVLLVVAGNETTRNSISGGIYALSQHPNEKRKLLDDPSLIPRAVDEIIRWVHPVIYMRRTALADTEIRGQQIREGDKLALWYMSGNRDEEKWDDPFTFDVTRNGPRHLSFGYGQHLCIGWRLAEIQLGVALEEILRRFPDMEAVGDVYRLRSNFLHSIKRMQVRFSPGQRAA